MLNKNTPISSRSNRIRETLDKLYEQHPPHFREQLRRLQQDPGSRVFAPLAESYRRLGRLEEAIEICQRGLEHHPDFHGGRVALAKCYIDKHRFEDAQRELERVVHLAPENLLAQKLLGEAFMAQELPQQALHAFKMALLLAPCDISLTDKVHQIEKQMAQETPQQRPIEQAEIQEEVLESSMTAIRPETRLPEENSAADWDTGAIEAIAIEPQLEEFPMEEPADDELSAEVNAILGFDEASEDTYAVGSLASAFTESSENSQQEITTETLGDLYFSQGQFGQSLKIFEKIYRSKPTVDLEKKMKACRVKLGVDPESQVRSKKIEVLQGILQRLHQQSSPKE
ncbi:tetratricopeptide repeat protein [bacterium]|nr:tetratricopeptide repeat protein [bacterium]NBX81965.1 tetratricopeptide repeat protein [bacterium]